MIAIILIWTYIFVVTVVAGFLLQVSLNRKSYSEEPFKNPILLSVVGYCIITALFSIYALFFKVAFNANLFLLITEIIGCLIYRKYFISFIKAGILNVKKINYFQVAIFLLIVFNVLFMNINGVYFDSDTGLYHAQAIQWIEKYPAIPGLGNLFPNYAFNSSFFITSALFSFSFLNNFSYHVLNSYFLLILLVFLVQKIHRKSYYYIIYAFLIIPAFYFFRLDSSLPYPDAIIYFLEIFVFILFIEKIITNSIKSIDFNSLAIVLIIFTCITTKLSALPVFIVLPLVLYYAKDNVKFKDSLKIIFIALIIVLPWLTRNVILSGYLLFPYPEIDLFNVDWKVPFSEAIITKSWIFSHARILEQYDNFTLSYNQWLPIWFKNQTAINILSLVCSISGIIILLIIKIYRKGLRQFTTQPVLSFGLIYLLCILFWFFMAPAFRFGYAYIFVCISIVLFYFVDALLVNIKQIRTATLTLLILFAIFSSIWPIKMIASGELNLKQHLINPEIKYKPIICVEKNLKGLIISMPVGNKRCWNQPIPCTPRLYNSIQLRGNDLSSGFKIDHPDSISYSIPNIN